MCDKKPYCNPRIDTCLIEIVKMINQDKNLKTILSCCGHEKYPKTIIVLNRETNKVFEWFSKFKLSDGIRKPKRYYKKDSEGYYYIPEIKHFKF